MIYISAVGMINALGNSLDEIAANLARGSAPGMRPRAGWLQGNPEAVLGGVEESYPLSLRRFPLIVPVIINCCWPRWSRSSRRLMKPSPGLAAIGLPS